MLYVTRNKIFKLLVFVVIKYHVSAFKDHLPQQVHLSFSDNSFDIVVTWSTMDDAVDSIVRYGTNELTQSVQGSSHKFVDGTHSQYIHKTTLSGLKPSTRYIYQCGGRHGWSPEFWFVTSSNKADTSIRVAIYGDMGLKNAKSLPYILEDTQRGMYDAILHNGDFAYDLHSQNGKCGDRFMRQIEQIAAYVPYMASPGNHEAAYNFSNYKARFNMPGDTDNYFHSFNKGPVHFIMFSTEVYYFTEYGHQSIISQFEWLKKDLIDANKPQNRAVRPWIITLGHRPMFCSNKNYDDCTNRNDLVRVGLENLFHEYTVDVEIGSHEHSYERMWPLYNFKVFNGSRKTPYTNPGAPVHLVTGAAGCPEGHDSFVRDPPDWSAFHSRDYGYTRMQAFNKTHLHFEQVSADKKGAIIDSFYIVKHHHLPYGSQTNADEP